MPSLCLPAAEHPRCHPCGPCTHRNETEKCQWHILEPVYVQLVTILRFLVKLLIANPFIAKNGSAEKNMLILNDGSPTWKERMRSFMASCRPLLPRSILTTIQFHTTPWMNVVYSGLCDKGCLTWQAQAIFLLNSRPLQVEIECFGSLLYPCKPCRRVLTTLFYRDGLFSMTICDRSILE